MNSECSSADVLNYDCDVEKKCHGHGVRHLHLSVYLSVSQVYLTLTCPSTCLSLRCTSH